MSTVYLINSIYKSVPILLSEVYYSEIILNEDFVSEVILNETLRAIGNYNEG